jgi:hypothetical protein
MTRTLLFLITLIFLLWMWAWVEVTNYSPVEHYKQNPGAYKVVYQDKDVTVWDRR